MLFLPMLFAFWSASLTIASWASIVHRTVKKGEKNPIGTLTYPYLAFNLIILMMISTAWGMMITHDSLDTKQLWSKIGQISLAGPEVVLAFSAIFYGATLIRMIRAGLKKLERSAADKQRQMSACYKTAAILITFAVMFLCQASIEIIAGWFPDIYLKQIL